MSDYYPSCYSKCLYIISRISVLHVYWHDYHYLSQLCSWTELDHCMGLEYGRLINTK